MVDRTLITTADIRTWPEDKKEPVLFLGEWCRRHSLRERWEGMDAKVAPYHWDNREQLHSDYKYLSNVYEDILSELSKDLNKLHGKQYSQRYWRIFIGPWLGCFVQVVFDRWVMLDYVFNNYKIHKLYTSSELSEQNVPIDMRQFTDMMVSDLWNEAIYKQISEIIKPDILCKKDNGFSFEEVSRNSKKQPVLRNYLYKFINFLSRLRCKKDKYFFIATYLPFFSEMYLNIKLGQFPRYWKSADIQKTKINNSKRYSLAKNINSDSDSFKSILRVLIPRQIPSAYVESYEILNDELKRLNWPLAPEVIFTSNSFYSDDLFKYWAASKCENGSKLIIGQHGGLFNMTKFSFLEEHQHQVSDAWFSWEAKINSPGSKVSIGMFHHSINGKVRHDKKGGAILVELKIPRYSFHLNAVPVSSQWLSYFNDQTVFVRSLPYDIQSKLTVRLFCKDYGWDQLQRWTEEFPNISIDKGSEKFRKVVSKSRIFIGTYNATTYLEVFNWNIPTILFWNKNHWELEKDAEVQFKELELVGVFHNSPESAAIHLANIWNDVDNWWYSDSVQMAVKGFCHIYAHNTKNQVDRMKFCIKSAHV